MSLTVPANVRGPILDLTLPASEDAIDLTVINDTTGKSVTVSLPAGWDGSDLSLDWCRRTITDSSGVDRSALLNPEDNGLWLVAEPMQTGANDIRVKVAGERRILIPEGAVAPNGIATDGTYLYWTNYAAKAIGRAKLDGTGVNQAWLATTNNVADLAVLGEFLYFAHGSAIGRVKLDGTGANQTFITGASTANGIAVSSEFVYWSNFGTNKIGRAKLDGTGVNQSFIEGCSGPGGIAVNATHIYWPNYTSNRIGRAVIAGTSPNQSFVTAVFASNSVAVDASYLYWTNGNSESEPDGSIGRAKLDGTEADRFWLTLQDRDSSRIEISAEYLYWTSIVNKDISRSLRTTAVDATLRWEKGYY